MTYLDPEPFFPDSDPHQKIKWILSTDKFWGKNYETEPKK